MKGAFFRILSGSEQGIPDVSLIAFFVFFGLLAGIILREIQKKVKLPYTPVLLVLGLLASLIGSNVTVFGETTALVSQIDPTGILLIFIPILIFESSFKADWHIFKRSMKKILLLAGPGLVFSFALTAVGMKVILRYDDDEMPWSAALMLGAIVAATDPVAIVALLKSLGAPHYFSTIVEGESLLNDGTGVVFFTIFENIANGKNVSVGVGIGFFLFLCTGGVVLGFLFSLLAASWLEKIFNDSVLSISITITASYLLFWVSETFRASFTSEVKAGVSGILALCTLGLFLSAYGKTKIPVRVEHPLHAVIQWAQYVSETLIFLLTGIIVGKVLFHPELTIGASDWMRLIFFFIMINLIRAALIVTMSPLLKRGSYKMNFKELFILSYAGLRGALGLSLALTVHYDEGTLSRRTRELVLFYVAGTAALTLLINGTTTGLLVKKIKLIKEFPIKKKMFSTFVSEIEQVTCKSYEKLRVENPAAVCDWESVKKVLNIKDEVLVQNAEMGELTGNVDGLEVQIHSEDELRTEARYKMLHIFRELIWKRYEDGEIEAYGANALDKAVNVSLDDLQDPINIFEFLYLYFMNPRSLKLFSKLLKIPLIGRYFRSLVVNQMVFIYDVSTSLASIVDELKEEIEKMTFPERIMKEVFTEFEADQKNAVSYLHKLEDQFLEIITYITTKRYITKILMAQKKVITDRYNISAIETNEYEKLIHEIEKKIRNLPKVLKVKWEPPTFSSLILSFPVFNMLSEEQIKRIIANSKKVKFKEGQYLFQEGEPFDGIYLITKGDLKTNYKSYKSAQRGVGRLISLFNLVMFDNISRIDCKATQKVEAHKIDLGVLREMMQESPKFEEKVYKGAFGYLRFMKPKEAKDLAKMSDIQIKALAQSSELVQFTKGKSIKLPSGGFVIKGMLKRWENVYEEYYMVPKHSKAVIAQTDGILLKFHTTEFGTRRKNSSPGRKNSLDFNWEFNYPLLARNRSESKTPNRLRKREANSEIIRPQPTRSIWSFEIDLGKED